MSMWLRQSTSVVVQFGPFLDKTDGVTLETAIAAATLDHLTTGIMISKNGGTLAVRNGTPTASAYDAHGMYKITLNTTDTGTLGTLRMVFTDAATHLPVWQDFMVVTANVWDSMFGADALQVDTIQVGGTVQTARDLGASVLLSSGTGAGQISLSSGLVTLAGVTHTGAVIPTVTTLTNLPAITAGWLTAAGIAAAALNGKGDWNVGKTGYSLTQSFPTNFADMAITVTTGKVTVGTNDDKTSYQLAADQAVNATKFGGAAVTATTSVTFPAASTVATTTGAVGSVTGAVGSLGAQAKLDVNAEVDTALADANLDHLVGTATGIPAIPAGTFIDQIMDDGTAVYDRTTDSLQAVRDHIGNGTNLTEAGGDGDHLTAINLPNQTMDIVGNITGDLSGSVGSVNGAVGSVTAEVTADVTKISGSATAANNLEASALGIVTGACEGVPTTTVVQTDLAEATDDHYIGRVIVFTSGAAAGQASDITDYTGATGTVTITAITTAPAAADTFVIV